ncbi:hypothetical protein SUDANB43_02592 [Streptomyces sp. enrichment culture]
MNTEREQSGSPTLEVLELLAQDSPLHHFQELLNHGRRRLSQDQFAELERATQLATNIHAATVQRRQREATMSALVDTVHEMTMPYDPDALLKVITNRARRLLGSDMAYISLNTGDGTTYIHSSDGDTTSLNVGLVVEQSHGLGAMAQEAGAPFWTPDYLNDTRIPHGERIDEVVRVEGLHAVMAVPISSGGEAIGVLYTADRSARHYLPDEISVMRSIADFAAVALDRTRMLDRTRSEMAELELVRIAARRAAAHSEQLDDVRARMITQVLADGNLQDLVSVAAGVLGGSLAVADAHRRVLASAGDAWEMGEELRERARLEAHTARGLVSLDDGIWATPVAAGAEDLGVVLFRSGASQPPTPELERFFRFVGQAVALLLVMQRSTAVAAGPVRDALLDDLLVPSRHPSSQFTHRARRVGLDPDSPYVVVLAHPEGGEHGRAVVWASSYAYRQCGLKTVSGDSVVLLLPGSDASSAARAVFEELSPLLSEPVTVAASGPADCLGRVADLYQEAVSCYDALIALGGAGSAASMDELGFLGLLLSGGHDVDGFIGLTIGPLLDHDAERATDLVATVEAYFASGNSPTRAAEELHVHANTVARRLTRITGVLGPDWQQPPRAVDIQLAVRLLRAREVLRRRRDQADMPGR